MTRLLLTIQYVGTAYHGWQVQPNGVTVQERLQDAIEKVTGVRSGVIGCSRTDAGVHAKMFCCTLDTEYPLQGEKMAKALNAHLPKDIAVYKVREVAPDFHPRYQAVGKTYTYCIWNGKHRNPFYEDRALFISKTLDEGVMDKAAKGFCGTHDYKAFCSAGSDVEDTVRTVSECSVKREGDLVTVTVTANGFLYNMVRILVGTLLDIEAGRLPSDAIKQALDTTKRQDLGATAPPMGLYLEKVYY
ncbi:MAG: tRNA pseudouridine(38-40) synthase TruA [Clostridia bacterium]|nr:tRNA pseudouridine(38-40) synthase TruA [Clostridia bacterium]